MLLYKKPAAQALRCSCYIGGASLFHSSSIFFLNKYKWNKPEILIFAYKHGNFSNRCTDPVSVDLRWPRFAKHCFLSACKKIFVAAAKRQVVGGICWLKTLLRMSPGRGRVICCWESPRPIQIVALTQQTDFEGEICVISEKIHPGFG